MLWVDQESYFGPDRRVSKALRAFNERRKFNSAGHPPQLPTALRQLRQRVIDAQGKKLDGFLARTHGIALLAKYREEMQAARELSDMTDRLARNRDADMRPSIYEALDRTHALLKVMH